MPFSKTSLTALPVLLGTVRSEYRRHSRQDHLDGQPVEDTARDVGSTGATGFGVTALCIGAERGWIARDKARERVRNTLSFYADKAKDEHGWFYHFINVVTGERNGTSEVSVSDATWLFAGALTAKQYFHEDAEIGRLADKIYQRVDYDWIRNGDPYLMSHGYRPETGLLPAATRSTASWR